MRLLAYRHMFTGTIILSAQPVEVLQHEGYESVPHLDEPIRLPILEKLMASTETAKLAGTTMSEFPPSGAV